MHDTADPRNGIVLSIVAFALARTSPRRRRDRSPGGRETATQRTGGSDRGEPSARRPSSIAPARRALAARVDALDLAIVALLLGQPQLLDALGLPDPAALQPLADGRTRSAALVPWIAVLMGLAEKDPLALATRRRIYERVEEFPGLHLSEIAREIDLDTNHVKYHLRVLEENDLVSSRRDEGYWRFYPCEGCVAGKREIYEPREKAWLALMRRRVPLQIALVLADRGTAAASELSEAVDVAPSTLHYHATKMEEVDLLDSRKEGRKRVYRLAHPERFRELAARHEPPDELTRGFLEAWKALEL